jgi:hypothetical protein
LRAHLFYAQQESFRNRWKSLTRSSSKTKPWIDHDRLKKLSSLSLPRSSNLKSCSVKYCYSFAGFRRHIVSRTFRMSDRQTLWRQNSERVWNFSIIRGVSKTTKPIFGNLLCENYLITERSFLILRKIRLLVVEWYTFRTKWRENEQIRVG